MLHLDGHELATLLATYGYWSVLVLVTVESFGIPVPGESMLLTAAIYAGTTHRLQLWLVIAAAATGAIVGDNLGYLAGREGGARLVTQFGRYVGLDERKLRLGRYLFGTHGRKAVFFGRFVAVLRMWAAFLAGTYAMPWRIFLTYNSLGGIVWATGMGLLAYGYGASVAHVGGPLGIVSAGVATALVGGLLVTLHRQQRRLQRQADSMVAGGEALAA